MGCLDNPVELWKFKNLVVKNASLVEICREYGLQLEKSHNDCYKLYCPFHKTKSGRVEKTASMFIYENTNSFYCFGCGRGNSVIDFVQMIDGCPAEFAILKLAKRIGLVDNEGQSDEFKIKSLGGEGVFEEVKTIEPYLFEISLALKNYLACFINTEKFEKEFKWMEKVAEKVDEIMCNVEYEEWEYAQEVCESVKKSINKRMKKK